MPLALLSTQRLRHCLACAHYALVAALPEDTMLGHHSTPTHCTSGIALPKHTVPQSQLYLRPLFLGHHSAPTHCRLLDLNSL